MEGFKLNEQIKHIFNEALLDCSVGASLGNQNALAVAEKFKRFIEIDGVPVGELGWLYEFYQKQKKDVDQLTDPRLDPLKAEVNYMVNFLNGRYKFSDDGGLLMVEAVL